MKKVPQNLRDRKRVQQIIPERKYLTGQGKIWLLKITFARQFAHQMPQGTPLRGRSRYVGTCFEQRSCRRNRVCPRCVSYRGTGRLAHLPGIFSGKCRRSGRVFCADVVNPVSWWERSWHCVCQTHPHRDRCPQIQRWSCGVENGETIPSFV